MDEALFAFFLVRPCDLHPHFTAISSGRGFRGVEELLSDTVVIGNAERDAEAYRGWFIGHFVPPELGPRSTDAVEIKWGTHTNGETRAGWAASGDATSLSLLIRGRIRLFFASGEEALLAQPGDYALWAPGVAHTWQIEQDDTVVFTVRWPSTGT